MKAMIVDDSRAMRSMLRKILKENGFEVAAEAENGRDALKQLEQHEFLDLMLLDWNMPIMNGYDLLCEVRKQAKWKDMRVMLVTTETEASQIIRALDAGADEYLIKPFVKEALRDKLNVMGLLEGFES
ncbi:MAG TPA: response regulator [Polyangiales bacterium]|nr:response regulator [Polyangiales bacterium]